MRHSDEIQKELRSYGRTNFAKRLELALELSAAMHKEFPDKKK